MQRFFFDIQTGATQNDDEDGQDCLDEREACSRALACLTQLVQGRRSCADRTELLCEVRDMRGHIVCIASLSLKVVWPL